MKKEELLNYLLIFMRQSPDILNVDYVNSAEPIAGREAGPSYLIGGVDILQSGNPAGRHGGQ